MTEKLQSSPVETAAWASLRHSGSSKRGHMFNHGRRQSEVDIAVTISEKMSLVFRVTSQI